MRVNNPTVKILSTRTSKGGTTPIPTHVLANRQVNLKVLPHIGDVTVFVVTVGALVPLVVTIVPSSTFSQVTVDSILVAMVNSVLHAFVAIWTYHILRTLLANARRIGPTDFELKMQVRQRLACVGERHPLVAVLTVDELCSATVSTETLLHISLLVALVALSALPQIFAGTLQARDDIERFLALASHAKFHQIGGHLHIPL